MNRPANPVTLYDAAGEPHPIFTNFIGGPPAGALALEYRTGNIGRWITDEDTLAEVKAAGAELLYLPQVDRV